MATHTAKSHITQIIHDDDSKDPWPGLGMYFINKRLKIWPN